MRDALPSSPHGHHRTGITCTLCRSTVVTAVEGLFHNPQRGRQQRFCSPACRQAAYRRRRAGAPETTPLQRDGGRDRSLNQQEPQN